ncbi:MAG: hypothetical protein WA058_03765 [Minisyncoccia bacterium]
MLNILKETRILMAAGKIHKKLISRVSMLFIISLILGVIVIYNLIFKSANSLIVGGLVIAGFAFGLFIFSRMNVVNWNEEDEVLQVGRMDTLGFVILGLYIAFEIGLRTLLKDFYPASATTFILAAIFGTLLGRAVGTIVEIHRVFRKV